MNNKQKQMLRLLLLCGVLASLLATGLIGLYIQWFEYQRDFVVEITN